MNIEKQGSLFGGEFAEDDQGKYSNKIEAPIYEPKNKKPHLMELVDTSKSNSLVREVIASDIPQDIKDFLVEAAKRHSIFNYEKIADYYAHASPEVQALMEKSALVIIDFGQAIQNGYVRLCEEIRSQYLEQSE